MEGIKKDLFSVIGWSVLLGAYVMWCILIFGAWLAPDWLVRVSFNTLGEGMFELILTAATFPAAIYVLTRYIKLNYKAGDAA